MITGLPVLETRYKGNMREVASEVPRMTVKYEPRTWLPKPVVGHGKRRWRRTPCWSVGDCAHITYLIRVDRGERRQVTVLPLMRI